MGQELMPDQLQREVGELKAGHEYLKQSVDRIEPKIDELTRTAYQTALTLERVDSRLSVGTTRMQDLEDRADGHGERIESLEGTRTKQAAYMTAAGVVGAGILAAIEVAIKAVSAILR